LLNQGRLGEAEQVLNLLKEEEYFEFTRRDPKAGTGSPLRFTPVESKAKAKEEELGNAVSSLGVRLAELVNSKARTTEQDAELDRVRESLHQANANYQAFLKQLRQEFKPSSDEAARLEEINRDTETMHTVGKFGPGTVAVLTLVAKDRYIAIVVTDRTHVSKSYSIPASELNHKVEAFRRVLQQKNSDPRPLGEELYKILVAPLESELQGAQAQTIMWSLHGTLRYLPIAALYDGQKYLVERYRNVVFTPFNQFDFKPVKWNALALGVSKEHQVGELHFPALANVPKELKAVVHDPNARDSSGVLPGSAKLDEQFTWKAALNELQARSHTVVHIASHFDFHPGDEGSSVLLVGDGKTIPLSAFKDEPDLFQKVNLLALSACNTAMSGGEGREVDGMAEMAQRAGAEAVLATLWSVDDPSTSQFMERFYKTHESSPEMTKAEALRQAQLAFVQGERASGDRSNGQAGTSKEDPSQASGKIRSVSPIEDDGATTAAPKFPSEGQPRYAHPYYWAPFILIGNWK
jgi:CHAT domain-containing protein